MKLKKLGAVLLAAIVMVTACFVMPITASADSLWSGSTDLGTSWGEWITVPAGRVAEGDTITITYTIGTGADYQQLKLLSSSWGALSSIEYDNPAADALVEYIDAGTSSYSFEVDATDAASISSSGMVIGGVNLIITDVSVESATEALPPVPPTADVELTGQSATSNKTITDYGTWKDGTSWLIDFKSDITTLAYAANYETIYTYLENFDHIEFVVNVSAYSGDVQVPGLEVKAHGQTADWAWYGGDQLALTADDVNKEYIYTLSVSALSEATYNSIGILIEDGTNYTVDGQSASVTYSVEATLCMDEVAEVETITLSDDAIELNVDGTETLTATLDPASATDTSVIWTSSDDDVATVEDGVVTAVGEGEATITATANGMLVSGTEVTDTCTVTVTAAAETAEATAEAETLESGSYGDGTYQELSDNDIGNITFGGSEMYSDYNSGTGVTYAQYANNGNSSIYRIYKLVAEEDLADMTSASIVIKHTNGKAYRLTTSKAYRKLTADQVAPEGYVYLAFVIDDAPEATDSTSGYYQCDLTWSDITLS